ncbi:MAG: hypothetical protein V8Q36_04850 [Anaerotignum sp.]
MKTKKENILVLVTAGKESKRFMELAKDAAEAGNGDLYILHVAQGENILESGEMYEMQRLADYGCRLGGQVCLCCEQDVAAYISRFAREKDITGVLLEPPGEKEKIYLERTAGADRGPFAAGHLSAFRERIGCRGSMTEKTQDASKFLLRKQRISFLLISSEELRLLSSEENNPVKT